MSRARREPRSTDSSKVKCSSGTERVLRRWAIPERRKPAARCSPSCASRAADSGPRTVKNTLACDWSPEISTPVSVTMPTRGSRTSRRISSASSRWICSAMRARRGALMTPSSEGARDLDHLEDLELVPDLHVVEVLDAESALETRFHFLHVVLEALERIELAGVHDHSAADDAHRRAAAHQTVGHHAAGDRADLGNLADVAHFDRADHRLLALWREHAVDRGLHVVDRVVDDVVVADIDAGVLGELARRGVRARVESDHPRLRAHRQVVGGLGDSP